jgi:hypothetical protein
VSSTLLRLIPARSLPDYTFVDFCAGAGGPTPTIERTLNARLLAASSSALLNGSPSTGPAQFVLTDLHPHLPSWSAASKRSENLTYISTPVDASAAPPDLLRLVSGGERRRHGRHMENKKIFRLFNLAFHHFDDPLAAAILKNTVETSDAFGIFELQDRTIGSFVTVTALGVLLLGISWWAFWGDWGQMFWTYLVPVVPLVVVLDGYVSCARTRTGEEVRRLMPKGWEEEGWKLKEGHEIHTWPCGKMSWVVGMKDRKD